MSKLLITTAISIFFLVTIFATAAVPAAQDSLSVLRSDYAGDRALCKVMMDGLYAANDVLGRPSEVRIVNGAVSRGASRFINGGRDMRIALGQTVRVTGIEETTTPKNDVLRVTASVSGVTIPIAFILESGTFAGMTEAQLQSLIGQVLQPVQRFPAEVQAGGLQIGDPRQTIGETIQSRPQPQATQAEPQRTALPSENVLALDGILKGHNGDAILKIEGVHAAMQSPDYTRDNVITDGVFQTRPPGGIYKGMRDMVLWPNSHVQFARLAAFTDDEHDILHLVLRSDLGAWAPIIFLLPKGQLSGLTKAKILKIMEPFVVFAAADSHTFRDEQPATGQASATKGTSLQTNLKGQTSLKASRTADKECLWIPYVSKKFALELLVESCSGRTQWKFGDAADGIGMSSGGSLETQFQVLTKPAAQAVESAIQQQVISKFSDSAARTNCRAVRTQGEGAPGWHQYQVQAFGAYAHPTATKAEESEKGDGLCEGMWGADVTTLFVYNPEVSRTHFFAFHGLSDPINILPFDIFSLRFRKVLE